MHWFSILLFYYVINFSFAKRCDFYTQPSFKVTDADMYIKCTCTYTVHVHVHVHVHVYLLKNTKVVFAICTSVGINNIFSSPCQRQCELLPSLGIRRLSSVNFSHFNLLLWNRKANWSEIWYEASMEGPL